MAKLEHNREETCTLGWCTSGALGYPYECQCKYGLVHAQFKDFIEDSNLIELYEWCDDCDYEAVVQRDRV